MNPHNYYVALFSKQAGKPYPATFRKFQVEPPRFELGFSPCHGGVFPLDHDPFHTEVRSRIELDLRSYQERVLRNTYKPFRVIAEGIEPSVPCVSCRCLSRWTTRSSNKVVETGVEPAESLGSRPSRFSGLRTQHISGGSRSRTWQSELMRLR